MIGGPRESEAPGIFEKVRGILEEIAEELVGWVRRAAVTRLQR
jgi:hypothetical protein